MKEQITQMSEFIMLLCEKRSENEDEAAREKIENKMESTEEKNEITKDIGVTSMNLKSSRERTTKVVESEQGEECYPRIVVFRKISHERSIEDTCYSNEKKEKETLDAKGDDNK